MSLEIPFILDEDLKPRSGGKDVEEPETDRSEEEKKMKDCRVCMKENGDHMSYECPYLECIPDPKDTPVGEAYMIVCAHCGLSKHGHQDGTWEGRAIFDFRKSSLFVRQPDDTNDQVVGEHHATSEGRRATMDPCRIPFGIPKVWCGPCERGFIDFTDAFRKGLY
ncbi:hypothetical protein ACLB2K_052911 [Fragaria x ananassa]